ncbi:MAG: polyribonucleotide nucleotidyltransferase [Spirochaetes bacterium]|nr:polyribonucleotide nucleotidyltransferase [Spirochaetota bacterium]
MELQLPEITVSRVIHGKTVTLRTGRLARQAHGAVLTSIGSTQVLGTVVMDKSAPDQDFFPLSVHYIEKFYASGRIPGSYFKREAKPTDGEVLVCRLIDRPLRPLFPEGFLNEVQVIPTVLSFDRINPPDVVGMNAASAALVVSDIPFGGPVGAVRIGRLGGKFVVNPSKAEIAESTLNLVVAGTIKAITMIEGECHEMSEDEMLEAVGLAHEAIKEFVSLQNELREKAGKPKAVVPLFKYDETLKKGMWDEFFEPLRKAIQNPDKKTREADTARIMSEGEAKLKASVAPELQSQIKALFAQMEERIVRENILLHKLRADGRAMDEIRPIRCEVDVLENVHGSALFTRGQTQVLAVATLGSTKDSLRQEDITGEGNKAFFLHYNFPPYSVGETGRMGATGRREIGHGMLAERSLQAMMPPVDKFPYTVRLVSEVLESNGSSSMGTICSGSMALMVAGVPVKKAVAGIAMGLIMEGEKYQVLTDIQGLEDHLGDMDFKVAGTADGITGFQLDIKIEGITIPIMREALAQAKKARLDILGKMQAAIPAARTALSPNVPQMREITIPTDRIRNVIGPGGKNIKSITEKTGSDIDISDDGKVKVFAMTKELMDQTIGLIEAFTGIPRMGTLYEGTVRRIVPFGAFVEIMPGTDGLVHISEFSDRRIARVEDVAKEGDVLKVKVIGIDESGKVRLSHKQALLDEKNPPAEG